MSVRERWNGSLPASCWKKWCWRAQIQILWLISGTPKLLWAAAELPQLYSSFLKRASHLAPHTSKGSEESNLNGKRDEAFETLKPRITESSILIVPEQRKLFTRYINALQNAGGGWISLLDKIGRKCIIRCFSQTMGPSKFSYTVTIWKLLALFELIIVVKYIYLLAIPKRYQ